uniref:Alanine dehydrogenase n=1 Tax=Gracilinema caldarium TaxID=215591 RepID=A0A7C3EEZ2_9SPIR
MKIGCVKEIKKHEYRVGLTPSCVATYVQRGHQVYIQNGAGEGAGFEDAEYRAAGATLLPKAEDVYGSCQMIVKVKEPQSSEYPLLREGQILFTYLHLAADEEQTKALLKNKVTGIAYETIRLDDGSLPCLAPMSEIAGRLSVQEGAKYLERPFGGRGILLGGVPGVQRGKVAILGGGVVGTNAAKIALGMGAEVTLLDIRANRLAYLDDVFHGAVSTLYSTEANIRKVVAESDLVIGAVLIPGARAPKLVRREHLGLMKKRSVIVDVAVDQGGCVETTRPTTHDNPVYEVDGIVHYCVANMPGAVALTSTLALTSTTLPFGLEIAEKGAEAACRENPAIRRGLNTYKGQLICKEVAMAFNLPWTEAEQLL